MSIKHIDIAHLVHYDQIIRCLWYGEIMQRVQKKSLVDEVISRLQDHVKNTEAQLESRLPSEPDLMKQLGVGRSTLREAVGVLAHQGVLEVRQGDGTYVRAHPEDLEPLQHRIARASILEIYETRRGLELETARLAALRRDDTDLGVIESALLARQAAYETEDWDGYVGADVEFHFGIALAAKNRLLADMYQTFSTVLSEGLAQLARDPVMKYDEDPGDLHFDLFYAIHDRDVNAAILAAASNIDTTISRLHEFLD